MDGIWNEFAVSNSGETQQYVGTFALDPDWDPENLHVVVFPERDTNRRVLQSGEACRMYAVSVDNLTPTVVSSPVPVDFDAEVTYAGCVDDDVTVTLDKTGLPGDWDAEIVVGTSTFPTSTTFSSMTDGQTQAYTIRVIPGASAALGTVAVETGPASNLTVASIDEYGVFANTPAILYVNDDGGLARTDFESAITNAGHFYVTHEVDTQGEPSSALLAGYDAVIWNTGQPQSNTISPATQAELVAYLDAGGKMFLTSHGLLNQYGTGPAFIQNYLRVASFLQDRQALTCVGVASDPIGDGLNFSLSGPFPDFADVITPNSDGVVWLVGIMGDVAVRYDSGTFKTVFMTPALELAPGAERDLIMTRVLAWFFPNPTDVSPGLSTESAGFSLRQNAPNPFAGTTSVSFVVPATGPVSLEVFDVTGRRVVKLVDRDLASGSHTATWDGRDATGSRVASGVYLYRLSAGGESVAKEMVLRK